MPRYNKRLPSCDDEENLEPRKKELKHHVKNMTILSPFYAKSPYSRLKVEYHRFILSVSAL